MAPEVPIRVRERFPVDLGVVTDVQGVDPANGCMNYEGILMTREGDALVNRDVCVLGGQPRLPTLVLESVTQRIPPGARQLQPSNESNEGMDHRTIYIGTVYKNHQEQDDMIQGTRLA